MPDPGSFFGSCCGLACDKHAPCCVEQVASSSTAATLHVIQITDVYKLDNFPSLRTMIQNKRLDLHAKRGGPMGGSKTISMLTGDFLAPYLLASIDKGYGMMQMLNNTPIDYVTWGNHEHDQQHEHVMLRVAEYQGTWINTNMQDHESFQTCPCQRDSEVIEVRSADGNNVRRVGMIAVLSNDPKLYKPGAFGGATITDPWKTLAEYKEKLEKSGCDLVLPLCHLYEEQDERTAREFDFPVILSGHDHHIVDKVVEGTRILKPGSDGLFAVMLDITWDNESSVLPHIEVQLVNTTDYLPDAELAGRVRACYSALDPLIQTELATIPVRFRPLSSVNSRGCCTTCARFMCTAIRKALNVGAQEDKSCTPCDCVLINGGNFRGERLYADRAHMTLEDLMSELDEGIEIVIAEVLGSILQVGLRQTWGAPGGAWMQYDDQVVLDSQSLVASIAGQALDPNRLYRVGTSARFGINEIPSVRAYCLDNPHRRPDPDSGIPVHSLLLGLFAEEAWSKIFDAIDTNHDGHISESELLVLSANGFLDSSYVLDAMSKVAHLNVHPGERKFLQAIMSIAGDANRDGVLTLSELNSRRVKRQTALGAACVPEASYD